MFSYSLHRLRYNMVDEQAQFQETLYLTHIETIRLPRNVVQMLRPQHQLGYERFQVR